MLQRTPAPAAIAQNAPDPLEPIDTMSPPVSALLAEQRRWMSALESGGLGVWDLDPRLEQVHYSPQWKQRLGFPRLHEADATGFWRCRVHPEDFDAMLRALRAHLDGSQASYEARFRLRSNGSGYRTVLSRGRVVERDGSGQSRRMVGTMIDLTARDPARGRAGLVHEPWEPERASGPQPFHALIGTGMTSDSLRLFDQVHDLLDEATRTLALAKRR